MANATRAVSVMNAVRAASSQNYQSFIPEATLTNIAEVGNPIINYQAIRNEFCTLLPNIIFDTVLHNRVWNNEFAFLRKALPMGSDVEEIAVNPAKAEKFDPENDYLTGYFDKPDIKVAFHRLNRKDQFKARIQNNELKLAFRSWEDLDDLIAGVINSLYNGDNIEEFALLKNTINSALAKGYVSTVQVAEPTDEASAKAFMRKVRQTYIDFRFPSSRFNRYAEISGDGKPYITFSPTEETMIIISSAVSSIVDVDVLAAAFNMERADFMGRVIYVDDFGIDGVYALMCDRRFFQIYDSLRETGSFYNPARMEWRYFWNVWQTYSVSPLANAVIFTSIADGKVDGAQLSAGQDTVTLSDAATDVVVDASDFNNTVSLFLMGNNIPNNQTVTATATKDGSGTSASVVTVTYKSGNQYTVTYDKKTTTTSEKTQVVLKIGSDIIGAFTVDNSK